MEASIMMRVEQEMRAAKVEENGREIYTLIERLYPICRSITGDGVRQTLGILSEDLELDIHEVPTGTEVFDWTVPLEWNIKDAYIKDPKGNRVVDFQESNLHVVGYSKPINRKLSLGELKKHLHTLPDYPDWIPYRTAYYDQSWGFCLSQDQLDSLPEGEYEVLIDSELEPGNLTYGDCYLPGKSDEEILISAHICHPSLCNDNLSGVGVAWRLAREVAKQTRRYSYRFIFAPATIGAITWLAQNEGHAQENIKHGLVLACVGDPGNPTYKRSRQGLAEIDRVVGYVLEESGVDYSVEDFSPYGYDERQYNSPGFDLPVGSLMRTPNACFPEYHTSADNLDFITPESLGDTYQKVLKVFEILELNRTYLNLNPKCEPQLGKRGLFRSIGGPDIDLEPLTLLWVLNLSDGTHNLLDIAERSGISFEKIQAAAQILVDHDLLQGKNQE